MRRVKVIQRQRSDVIRGCKLYRRTQIRCVNVHAHVCMCTQSHPHMHPVCIPTCTHVHTHAHAYMYTHMRTHMHMHTQSHTCMHTHNPLCDSVSDNCMNQMQSINLAPTGESLTSILKEKEDAGKKKLKDKMPPKNASPPHHPSLKESKFLSSYPPSSPKTKKTNKPKIGT